jgi:tetratricopeptide (TPR) repeat protein
LPPRIDNSFFIFFHKFLKVADGNPRLLEWLMALALRTDGIQGVIDDAFLDRLGAEVSRFRESILAKTLLGALSGPERKALARMILFELAVPMAVVAELAQGASLESALSLGLLEKQVTHGEDLYRVTTVLEPLLQPALSEAEWSEARRRAARKLHEVWWDDPEERREARGLEVVRVAVAAGERELAVGPADEIAKGWVNRSRYQEALALCRLVLAAFDDYRILGTIARAEVVLGDTDLAKSHYERALTGCPPSDEREKSATIHNLAALEAQQGDVERALQLWQQSLQIDERIGDVQGKAATLHEMAGVIAQQGEIERALQLWQQSLEIQERIGDVKGKAATLNNMAGVIAQQGEIERALQLWQQSLEIKERIGDVQGKAATLANMASLIAQQGDIERALQLWQQSLEIEERIGDIRGKAATLRQMAGVIAQQGDIERALQLWQQSLEIGERIGDVQGQAATLHNMAGVIAQQGNIERALQLWQQSLEIQERIGDVQGKAATLAQMAWAAGQSGDHAHRDRLNRQAAQALGSIRAYLDLITVLGNLGASAQQEREIFAAQAAWLVLRVQAPVDRSLQVLGLLFNLVAQGDPLEPLLGAAATIVVATCGGNHPQREKLLEKAGNLLSIAAGNAGIQSPEAYQQWFAQNRLADRAHVFPRLLALLEQRIAGSWLFDRAPLREHGDSSSAG